MVCLLVPNDTISPACVPLTNVKWEVVDGTSPATTLAGPINGAPTDDITGDATSFVGGTYDQPQINEDVWAAYSVVRYIRTVTDTCGNIDSYSIDVNIEQPQPTASFTFAETANPCEYQFTDTSSDGGCASGITSWAWTFKNADTLATITTSSAQNPLITIGTVPPGTCTNFIAELVVTTNCGSDAATETGLIDPVAVQTTPDLVTTPGSARLDGTPSYAFDSDSQEDTYQWTLKNASGDTLAVIPHASGATAVSQNGLTGTNAAPIIDLQYFYENFLCSQAPVANFTANSTGTSGQIQFTSTSNDLGCTGGITVYSWTIYDTDGITVLSTASASSFNYTFASDGVYPVTLNITTGCGIASYTKNVSVALNATPILNSFTSAANSIIDSTGSVGNEVRARIDTGDTGVINYDSGWVVNTGNVIFTATGHVLADGDRIYIEVRNSSTGPSSVLSYKIPNSVVVLNDISDYTDITYSISSVFGSSTSQRNFEIEFLNSSAVVVASTTVQGSSETLANRTVNLVPYGVVSPSNFTIRVRAYDEVGSEITKSTVSPAFVKGVRTELKTIVTTDTVPSITYAPNNTNNVTIYVNGVGYTNMITNPAFSVSGNTITWNPANVPFTLNPGQQVIVEYAYNEVVTTDVREIQLMTVTVEDELPSLLTSTPNKPDNTHLFVNGISYSHLTTTPVYSQTGTILTWIPGNSPFTLTVGTEVIADYTTGNAASTQQQVREKQTIAVDDTIPSVLSNTPDDADNVKIYVNGQVFHRLGATPAFSVTGTTVTWNPGNVAFTLSAGTEIIIEYTY